MNQSIKRICLTIFCILLVSLPMLTASASEGIGIKSEAHNSLEVAAIASTYDSVTKQAQQDFIIYRSVGETSSMTEQTSNAYYSQRQTAYSQTCKITLDSQCSVDADRQLHYESATVSNVISYSVNGQVFQAQTYNLAFSSDRTVCMVYLNGAYYSALPPYEFIQSGTETAVFYAGHTNAAPPADFDPQMLLLAEQILETVNN